MLRGIPNVLSPELLKTIDEMGHGDRIVLADGNFPIGMMGKDSCIIRADGHGIPEILDAILQFFPLDKYVVTPVNLMKVMDGDPVETPIWDTYEDIVGKYDERSGNAIGHMERYAFYEEARKCVAIVATGESALYANIMLQKGVVVDE